MAEHALEFAFEVHPDASITVLHVVGDPSGMMGEAARIALDDDPRAVAEELSADVFERAAEIAAEHDATVETAVGLGRPSRVVVNRADDYDLVVMGSHGGDVASRLFTGNVAERVFRRSTVPVTSVR